MQLKIFSFLKMATTVYEREIRGASPSLFSFCSPLSSLPQLLRACVLDYLERGGKQASIRGSFQTISCTKNKLEGLGGLEREEGLKQLFSDK